MIDLFKDPIYVADYKRNTNKSIEYVIQREINPKIFVDSIEHGSKQIDSTEMSDEGLENWHLPFKELSVVCGKLVVILSSTNLCNKCMWITLIDTVHGDFVKGIIEIYKIEEKPENIVISPKPSQFTRKLNESWVLMMEVDVMKNKDGKITPTNTITEKGRLAFYYHSIYIIDYFYPFCVDKEMFVVESQVGRKKKGKIQTKGKSTYQLIHVSKIMKRFTPTGQPGQPLTKGHPRRAHKREYRDDRWTNMKGRSIIVKSTWVGPKTVLSEGRLYKVHTDVY